MLTALTVNTVRFRKSFLPYILLKQFLVEFTCYDIYYTINILLAFYIIFVLFYCISMTLCRSSLWLLYEISH